MKSKLLRLSITAALLMVLFMLGGCFKKNEVKTSNTENSKQQKEISIAYVASEMPAPQAVVGRQEKIFENILAEKGYKIRWIHTRSRDKTGQIMDKKDADFFYLFTSNFTSYMTETTPKWGGSDNYSIIAGAMNKPTYHLVLNPKINSLKELDGKTVGISNHNYMEELLLNYELEKAGLKTKSMGGTVNIEYQDVNTEFIKSFAQNKYAAISSWAALKPAILKSVPNARFLPVMTLNKSSLGYINLLATKEIIQQDPDLVKLMLKAHLEATERAKALEDKLPAMVKEDYDNYFTKELTNVKSYPQYPLDYYENLWKNIDITYTPDTDLITRIVDFDTKAGYLKNKTVKNFIDVTILNEVLKEMGKSTVT